VSSNMHTTITNCCFLLIGTNFFLFMSLPNLSLDVTYPNWGLLWFCSVHPNKCHDSCQHPSRV
jgi:hypothetical protein